MKQMAFYSLVLVSIASLSIPSFYLRIYILWYIPPKFHDFSRPYFFHMSFVFSASAPYSLCAQRFPFPFPSNVISLGKTSLISCLSPKLLLYSHVLHIKLTFQIHNRIQNYWSYGETGTLMHCWWEYKLAWSHWKAIWKCRMKMHMLVDFFSSFSWMLPL